MIKKLIFATIIFLGLLTPVSSFAMELSLPEIYSLSDLGYGLAIGAQWDFTGKDEYLIDNLPQLSPAEIDAAATMRVRHFLEQYAINRGIPYAQDGQVYDNPKDYLVSTYFNKTVLNLYQKHQIELANGNVNADATLRMPISRQRVTDWSGYKIGIAERYLNSYVYGMDIPDNPIVNPDPAYVQYLESANGHSATQFFWYGGFPNTTVSGSRTYNVLISDTTQNSWFDYENSSFYVFNFNQNSGYSSNTGYYSASSEILSLYIIEENGTFTGTIQNITAVPLTSWSSYQFYQGRIQYNNDGTFNRIYVNTGSTNNIATNLTAIYTANNLQDCLSWFTNRFRNINIYVNGDAWDLVSDPAPSDPLIPDFPDVINTDYGPIETVDLPATPDNNGTFDITSLFDAIKEAIIGASDTDPDTDGVLDKDGITDTYRDDAGELTGDEDIPLEDAIDDSFPIQDTSNYPDIILPYEPIHNAFMGTTVLAQLINATQTVLPEELILVFWGIVFILFIIGLIKILHK